jgi:hypothetical protein
MVAFWISIGRNFVEPENMTEAINDAIAEKVIAIKVLITARCCPAESCSIAAALKAGQYTHRSTVPTSENMSDTCPPSASRSTSGFPRTNEAARPK